MYAHVGAHASKFACTGMNVRERVRMDNHPEFTKVSCTRVFRTASSYVDLFVFVIANFLPACVLACSFACTFLAV